MRYHAERARIVKSILLDYAQDLARGANPTEAGSFDSLEELLTDLIDDLKRQLKVHKEESNE